MTTVSPDPFLPCSPWGPCAPIGPDSPFSPEAPGAPGAPAGPGTGVGTGTTAGGVVTTVEEGAGLSHPAKEIRTSPTHSASEYFMSCSISC